MDPNHDLRSLMSERATLASSLGVSVDDEVFFLEDLLQEVQALSGHTSYVCYMLTRGNLLFTASSDKTIKVIQQATA